MSTLISLYAGPVCHLFTTIIADSNYQASKSYKGKGIANPVVDGQNSSAGASTSGTVGGAD